MPDVSVDAVDTAVSHLLHQVPNCGDELPQASVELIEPLTSSMPCPLGKAYAVGATGSGCPWSSTPVHRLLGSQSLSWSLSHRIGLPVSLIRNW
jgi:hypothetical protein